MRWLLASLALLIASDAFAGFDGDPFFEQATAPNGTEFLAVRPFYSRSVEPAHERARSDFLWPLYTRKSFKDEQYSRFLFFGFSNDFSSADERHRRWVLPFYFQGVDAQGDGYFALFPFGGTIHEFLGRDEITFALFPLYVKTRINEVNTTTVLWPIFSKSKGDKVDRLRVWPLYGRAELKGTFRKKFVLWPIYHSVEYTNERNPGGGFIVVPIYGHIKTQRASNYWLAAPFIRYSTSDEQWIVHAPWPFIQLAGGKMYKRIFWPIYGKKKFGTLTRQYWLWPLFWNNQAEYTHHIEHRKVVAPIFVTESEVVTKPTMGYEVGDVAARYWKLWPLMSWERKQDQSRFRLLELWPMRHTPGIERNWAPYWTLYKRETAAGATGHHLLWGLYRQAKSEDAFEWSLLKGLAGYRKTADSRRYRFLFMWFGGEG